MTRLLATAVVSLAALTAAGSAAGATTRLDRHGTIVLDGRKVFPLVLSKGPPPSGYAEVAAGGVNFLRVGPSGPWNDAELAEAVAANAAAAATGLHTWIDLSALSTASLWSPEEAMFRRVVRSLEADPSGRAIGMWKGADEPSRLLVPPSWLRYVYCLGTGRGFRVWCAGRAPLDRDHLWVTIQAPRGGVPRLTRYSSVTDVHGVNRYPIAIGNPEPDLDDVGRWTNVLHWSTPSRAVWTTLQVCWTWSHDADANFTLPTFEQERFMAYDAIVNGARALAFYGGNNPRCWRPRDRERGWSWTFWERVLEPLARELGAASPLAPALLQPGTTRWLPTSDPTTQAILRRGASGEAWVIATHAGEEGESRNVTIGALPRWATGAEVHTEGRSVGAANGALTDVFGRWSVHVYRFRRPR